MLLQKTVRYCSAVLFLISTHKTAYAQDAASISTSAAPTPLISDVIGDVNLFSGDFETSINLYTLTSRNELSFPIVLAYDSDVTETAGALNKDKQASPQGLGWQLAIPYISTKISDAEGDGVPEYYDSYVEGNESNQMSYDIGTGLSKLQNYKYWKIRFISDAQGWEIITEEGTKMKFGHKRFLVYRNFDSPFWLGDYYTNVGYRWDLTEIEDIFGNKIILQYDDVFEYVSDWIDPLGNPRVLPNYANYTKASYLKKIVDNATGKVVKFNWDTRTDYNDGWSNYQGNGLSDNPGTGATDSYQETFTTQRLESIKAYDKDPDAYPATAQLIHDLRFEYDYRSYGSDAKLVLTSIRRYDPNGIINPLPALAFDYHPNTINPGGLKKITYPEGGERIIYYETKSSGCPSDWRVDYIDVDDKMGAAALRTNLAWSSAISYNSGEYCGHAWAEIDLSGNYGTTKYTFETVESSNLVGVLKITEHFNQASSTLKQKITNTWTAEDKGNGAYFRKLDKVDDLIDGVTTTTEYLHHATNGMPYEVKETNSDATIRKTLTSFAFQVYTGMLDKHMLSQVAQQTVYLNPASSTTARSATVTTWKQWPAASGKWAAEATYNWLENDASYNMPAFNFTTPPGDAEWIKTSKVLSRDSYGQSLEMEDANNNVTTTKWGYNWAMPLATISNGTNANTFVEDFEDGNMDDGIPADWYTTGAYWSITDGALHWTSSAGGLEGQCSNSIALGSTNYIAEFDIRIIDGNSPGDWGAFHFRKTGSTHDAWTSGYIVFITENGGVALYNSVDGVLGGGYYYMAGNAADWHHVRVVANGTNLKVYLDGLLIREATNSRYNGNYIGFYVYQSSVQFDNVRIYPLDAICTSQSYDPKTLRLTRQIDANGISIFNHYDGFGRLLHTRNDDRAALTAATFSDHSFSLSEPNFVENAAFPNGNYAPNWSFEWSANAAQSGWLPYVLGQLSIVDNSVVQSQFGDYALRIVDNSASPTNPDGAHFTFYNGEYEQGAYTSNDPEYHKLFGKPVVFSAWVRTASGTKNIRIGIEGNPSQVYSVGASWQRISVNISNLTYVEPSPASDWAKRLRCYIFLEGSQTGTIYVDGAVLELSSNTTPDPVLAAVSYSDGLGRNIQTQTRNGSYDIISRVTYNQIGLVDKQYKPQEISNSNHTYYSGLTGLYEQLDFFDDPVARVKKQTHMGGGSWISYDYNSAAFFTDPNTPTFRYVQITDEETSPGAKITKRFFDKWGRAIGGLEADGTSDQIKLVNDYDIVDNVTATKPPNYWGTPPYGSVKTDWDLINTYDTFGRLIQKDSPDEGLAKSKYDNANNLRYDQNAHQFDASKYDFTVFYYDKLNRLTLIGEEYDDYNWNTTSPDLANTNYGTESGEWKIKHYYDLSHVETAVPNTIPNYSFGRLTKTEVNEDSDAAPEHTTLYVYDKFGNLTEKRITIDGGSPITQKTIRHKYDLLGREIQLIYPSGNTIVRHMMTWDG